MNAALIHQIEYMVTGGLAAVVYGHPRLTLDVDLVLRMTPRDGSTFATLAPAVLLAEGRWWAGTE